MVWTHCLPGHIKDRVLDLAAPLLGLAARGFEAVLDLIITAWDWARAKLSGASGGGQAGGQAGERVTPARTDRGCPLALRAAAAVRADVGCGEPTQRPARAHALTPPPGGLCSTPPPAGATQRSAAEAAYFEPLAEVDPEDHRSPPLFPGR